MQVQLLLIGDLKSGKTELIKQAQNHNMSCIVVDDVDTGIDTLCNSRIDMVFLSVEENAGNFFAQYTESRLNTPVVIAGPVSKMKEAVKAIRMGAIEYLSFPLEAEAFNVLTGDLEVAQDSGPIYGDSKTGDLLQMAKQFAASDATVLLRGESGTGKEVMSKFIHQNSIRKSGPFISVNCAAIPENLLESELFGHEKGAFSGALQKRIGKFEQANGGTLLLDEISEMDINLQAKLLRAIQERVVDPVGSDKPVEVDIRLIATTNRDLEDYVAEGNFREDLYFRLNVIALDLLPLRERPGDILPLSQFFADKYGKQNGKEIVKISAEAGEKLVSCYWKGNVRELENTMHRAVLMMGMSDEIMPAHIVLSPMSLKAMGETQPQAQKEQVLSGAQVQANINRAAAGAYAAAASGYDAAQGGAGTMQKAQPAMIGRTVQDVERELILSTLNYCKGNRTHAANILGISIRTLRNKLNTYKEEGLIGA